MNRARPLVAVHVAACLLAGAFGEVVTGGVAGLHALGGATWNLGVLVMAMASLIVVGIAGARAIAGGRAGGGLLLGAAAAPAVVGAVGAVVHLSRTSAGGAAESVVLLDIEAALAILVYGLDWSAAALLAVHVAAACARRATVARLDRSTQRARLMTTGWSLAALTGPAFAALVAFWVDSECLPSAWDPSWQGPLRTATWAVGAALAVAAATAVPRAGDTRALADETTAPAVDSAAVATAVLFLGTALVVWGWRPFAPVHVPPAALAGGLGPLVVLLIGDAVAAGARPRLASLARGLWPVSLALATLSAVVGWSFVALVRIDWTRAPTFPAVVRADSVAVRRGDPGQLELVVGLDVENPLEGPVRAEGATGAAHALGNWSEDASERWNADVASHGRVARELRIPLTRDDLALPRDGDGLSIRARGDVMVDDGVHHGKVPFTAHGALTDADVQWLYTRPTGTAVRP